MTDTFCAEAHQAEFLKLLFATLDGAMIEVRCLREPRDQGDKPASRSTFHRSVPETLAGLPKTLAQQTGYGIFVGVCPRSQLDGTKGSIKQVHALWVDLDAKHVPGGKEAALEILRTFPLPCTLLVDSGHGCHAYWRLAEPVPIRSQADIDVVEACLRRLTSALRGDPAACELARVLRLPGTWNLKDPDHPVPVRIMELAPERRYRLAEFDKVLPPVDHNAPAAMSNPPGWVADLLQQLKDGERGDCHHVFVKLAGRLIHAGMGPEEIKTWLTLLLSQVSHDDHQFDEQKLEALVDDVCRRYPAAQSDSVIHTATASTESKWRTAKEFLQQAQWVEIPWAWEGYLARGLTTLLSARAKIGKTTLLFHLLQALLSGQTRFMDRRLQFKGKVLLLTEEPKEVLTRRLERFGLVGDELLIIRQFDVRSWPETLGQVRLAIEREGVSLVVLDVIDKFWSLKDENEAQEVVQALKPLQAIIQEHNAALLIHHHLRKQPGDEGTAHRGSGALVGAVDIALELYGHSKTTTQRILKAMSRLEETPTELVLELTPQGYACLGGPVVVEREERKREIVTVLPEAEEQAATYDELYQRLGKRVGETLLKELINELHEPDHRIMRRGDGVRGNPYRFWKVSSGDGTNLR